MKKALITGAGTGIGLACTKKFLENGWKVTAHYHVSLGALSHIHRNEGGQRLQLVRADFSNVREVEKFLAFVRKEDFDALINNAGVDDSSNGAHDRIMKISALFLVNTIVPTLIAQAAVARMKKRGKGRIVNVSSIAAKYGSNLERVFYGISKRGLEAATKSLAREGARANVLVNTVRPGVTDTDFHRASSKNLGKRREMIPLRRMARAEEVADFIYFLCAENTFITNEVLTIAGGE